MYGHTFILDGREEVICAYNAHDVASLTDALTGDHIGPNSPKIVLLTSIMSHLAKIAGQRSGFSDEATYKAKNRTDPRNASCTSPRGLR